MTDTNRVDRSKQEQVAQEAKEQLKPKDQKSKFDEAVEKQRIFQQSPNVTKVQEDHVKYENFREFTKQKEEHEDKKTDKKKDDEKKEGDVTEKKADAKIAEHKVIGKGSFKDGGGGGGDQGYKGGGFGSERRSKKELETKFKELGVKDIPADLKSKFAQKLRQSLGTQKTVLSQEVINKVIQFVKIRTNKLGEKEIELVLSEKIYKGLKLKVTTKEKGKVTVHLTTKNSKVRETLNEEKDGLKKAISSKGIDVEEIIIT